ncbi:hypothetical protein PHLGIDRAFT_114979 [Phlebiopsis gigantea 11061_1 CR5-6]|uniref:Uncharacterized protein n=1 Tax=Phlebiopsis gigantea (strain 11061_1 CR5-6) TaxID=745531 RepID=A0A0C3PTY4_PHLG1|nr:hypothetical protein PHLGIDRAFT_114979 [Phlebiopsis gigantea 11061_1 CR5-6]
MVAELDALIHRVRQGLSTVELVYTPHARWPLPPRDREPPRQLRVSVLDSSFNPPTLAHLALARLSPPGAFNARLLLLSVRNADKSLKAGDATYAQRLQMMTLLAQEASADDAAVAIADEPTFVGKSRTLQAYLQHRLSALAPSAGVRPPVPELTFVVGIDTLERILAVRYYASEDNMRRALRGFLSPSGDASRLLCARRVTPDSLETSDDRERRVAAEVGKYLEPGCVEMVDIGGDVESYSSSEVRQRIAEGDSLWTQMVPSPVAEYIRTQGLYVQE